MLFGARLYYSLSNNCLIFPETSVSMDLLIDPSFLCIKCLGIVTILCNLITESTVNPEPKEFSDSFLIIKSLSIKSSGILLEIKAIIT